MISWIYKRINNVKFVKFFILGVIMTIIGMMIRWVTYDKYHITVFIVEPIAVLIMFFIRYLVEIKIGVITDDFV